MVAIRAEESKVYPRYLFAVLRSPEAQRRIEEMHVGTLIPHFKKGDFDKLYLPIPARNAQKFIGDLYFEFSARIDLLRQANATLEAIAQALFKSWFIDFDPVRSKAEGREPEGMDAETAALFPSEFEESELGAIPKGWRVRSLDSFANYLNGLAMQKFPPESNEQYLPVIKIAQLRAGDISGADRASSRLKPDYIVRDGDVLFSWSG
jgi:type I restriction enzyme S subunit